MPKLPKAREVIRIALQLGFLYARQKGSHATYYRAKDNVNITIPVHGGTEISLPVFHQICKDMGITREEFWKTK
jgi:predicted RNA binding protein YcfA (HicA-like mRNA interferase family)